MDTSKNVRKFLDLSTGYLLPSTHRHIETGMAASAYAHPAGDGWFIWVPAPDDDNETMASPDLQAVYAAARARDCDYVLIDVDGPDLAGLRWYDEDTPCRCADGHIRLAGFLHPITDDDPAMQAAAYQTGAWGLCSICSEPSWPLWDVDEAAAAEQRGWGVFKRSDHIVTIQRIDSPDLPDAVQLEDDETAWRIVAAGYDSDDPLSRRAIDYVRHFNDNEADEILHHGRDMNALIGV